MLKKVYLRLTIIGNLVLMVAYILVAVGVRNFHFIYSLDIQISRDTFLPFVATSVILCLLSVVSVVWVAVDARMAARFPSQLAKLLLAASKMILSGFTLIVLAIPLMTTRHQTRFEGFLVNLKHDKK